MTIADMAKAVGKTGLSAYHMFLQKTTKGASFSRYKDTSLKYSKLQRVQVFPISMIYFLKMRCRLFISINVYVSIK